MFAIALALFALFVQSTSSVRVAASEPKPFDFFHTKNTTALSLKQMVAATESQANGEVCNNWCVEKEYTGDDLLFCQGFCNQTFANDECPAACYGYASVCNKALDLIEEENVKKYLPIAKAAISKFCTKSSEDVDDCIKRCDDEYSQNDYKNICYRYCGAYQGKCPDEYETNSKCKSEQDKTDDDSETKNLNKKMCDVLCPSSSIWWIFLIIGLVVVAIVVVVVLILVCRKKN